MDTTSTFLLALSSGLGGSIIASIITSRTALGDRETRLRVAKEDREFLQRRTACVDLEAQRLRQLVEAARIRHNGTVFASNADDVKPNEGVQTEQRETAKRGTADVSDRDIISEATVSLLLPDEVLTELLLLNDFYGKFTSFVSLHAGEEHDIAQRHIYWKSAMENFDKHKTQSEKLRSLLRSQMDTYPAQKEEE